MKYIHWWITINFIMVISCNNKISTYQKLDAIVSESYKQSISNFNTIVVLEENSCIACNKAYAKLIYNSMNDSVLLIIAATGSQYNVDIFNDLESGVVVNDYQNNIKKMGILKTSGAIFISNNQIDTIININNPKTLLKKLNYVKEKLKKI